MGFDDLVDCSCFISSAIGQMGHSVGAASHAIGELSKALNGYSYAEGYSSSLHCVQPTVVKEALEKYSSSHEVPTTDVLEKIQKEIEEWLKDPGISCQANLIDK